MMFKLDVTKLPKFNLDSVFKSGLEFKMDALSKVVGELGVRERRQRGRLCEV